MEPEVQLHVDQVVSQLQQPPGPSENASPVLGSTPCKDESTPGGDAMFQNFASQDDTGYGTSSGYDYSDSYSAPDPTSCGVARIEVAMHDALASISAISIRVPPVYEPHMKCILDQHESCCIVES